MFRSARVFLIAPLLASAMAVSALVVTPEPAAAACYWGPWKSSQATANHTYLTITSTVYFRVGYGCNGLATEVEVDARYVTINIRGGSPCSCWFGYTRDLQALNLYAADGAPVDYHDPNRSCTAANCVLTGQDVQNFHFFLYGSNGRPFVNIYCFRCDPSGFNSVQAVHYFRTNEFYANFQEWYPSSPR